jgi:hypothetical protein
MTAYYNEIDPLKAETIREAIRAAAEFIRAYREVRR